ncbi:MAG: AAA family ATPase, partial [Candidatus Lokiarchaeota archaeon]|nr:AAA family ATPase [Candidatus Lokiarchaeota archaeon]
MSTKTIRSRSSSDKLNQEVYIKEIILENFLAFSRDKAEFSKGFTIVVGPNWSGKSTIYQGIKFALGSNERDERYTKWSDFIRTGQNHALIELYIQTPENLIGIRRTVLRGKAPFFEIKQNNEKEFEKINSLEIRELVKSLNYNPDNQFSFVSQGKIDALKDMKPEELCIFLEEGVGLKGLRHEILEQKTQVFNLQEKLKALKTEQNSWNFELKLLEPKLKRLEDKRILLKDKESLTDELLWANREKIEKEIYI